jgi:probable rRNA maturation factor
VLKVSFNYVDRRLAITDKLKLREFIEELFMQEKKALQRLSYIFCSDEFLLQINKDFLQHDYYTDIITFDLSEGEEAISGEVYVSIDRIKDNATALKVSFIDEVLRVVFHGALHLCGYKDQKSTDIKLMREMENKYISSYKKCST